MCAGEVEKNHRGDMTRAVSEHESGRAGAGVEIRTGTKIDEGSGARIKVEVGVRVIKGTAGTVSEDEEGI
jgi:hypothetical protein